MSITDSCSLWLEDARKTASCGASLAHTLYDLPVTILLSGELGSGKTTFLQGFARALGIREPLTSPTYALEQRYETSRGSLIHLDLYRLKPPQAQELLRASEEYDCIRCIEWPERLGTNLTELFPRAIHLHFSEEGNGRRVSIGFEDVPLPSTAHIDAWRKEVHLPANIIAHCSAVATVCERSSDALLSRGIVVRPTAVARAGALHDLLRFIDFRDGAAPPGIVHTEDDEREWQKLRASFPGQRHEDACGTFLKQHGYSALAQIVTVHGIQYPPSSRLTPEQKMLFYADKRVKDDTIVSMEERFADFRVRYGDGEDSPASRRWYDESKALERELFPEGCPF